MWQLFLWEVSCSVWGGGGYQGIVVSEISHALPSLLSSQVSEEPAQTPGECSLVHIREFQLKEEQCANLWRSSLHLVLSATTPGRHSFPALCWLPVSRPQL